MNGFDTAWFPSTRKNTRSQRCMQNLMKLGQIRRAFCRCIMVGLNQGQAQLIFILLIASISSLRVIWMFCRGTAKRGGRDGLARSGIRRFKMRCKKISNIVTHIGLDLTQRDRVGDFAEFPFGVYGGPKRLHVKF